MQVCSITSRYLRPRLAAALVLNAAIVSHQISVVGHRKIAIKADVANAFDAAATAPIDWLLQIEAFGVAELHQALRDHPERAPLKRSA